MAPFLLRTNPTTPHPFTFFTLSFSSRPQKIPLKKSTVPARDRIIDFGRHKGKMMGSLPSTYLKWVSNNLRAGDFEPWAKLADQVLQDPVYRDRIEWEFADNVLNGNNNTKVDRIHRGEGSGAVSQLVELSERFGWDYEDKSGWSKVNFELLGTSNGGRIPRVSSSSSSSLLNDDDNGDGEEGSEEVLKMEEKGRSETEERRKERRIRVKEKKKMGIRDTGKGIFGYSHDGSRFEKEEKRADDDDDDAGIVRNPFPGREALLKKVIRSKRFM